MGGGGPNDHRRDPAEDMRTMDNGDRQWGQAPLHGVVTHERIRGIHNSNTLTIIRGKSCAVVVMGDATSMQRALEELIYKIDRRGQQEGGYG